MTDDEKLMSEVLEALNHVNVQDRVQIITALQKRLAQPAQQPVQEPFCHVYEYDSPHGLHRELYPREWNGMQPSRTLPLYTDPQPRQLQGLTDEEMEILEVQYMNTCQTAHQFLRAIEAKLKEKNT